MKKYSFIIVLLLFTTNMMAQNKDRIFMKNGSIINGYIQEMYPDSVIKIKTNDGNVFVFNAKDVLRTEYISSSNEKSWLNTNGKKTYELHKGYKGFVDVSGGVSLYDGEGYAGFSLSTTHGYQFNKHWFIGGGFGYCHLDYDEYIPIFTNARYNFDSRNGLFADIKFGSYLSSSNDTKAFLSPSFGYRIALTKNMGLNAAISCEWHMYEDCAFMVKLGIDF